MQGLPRTTSTRELTFESDENTKYWRYRLRSSVFSRRSSESPLRVTLMSTQVLRDQSVGSSWKARYLLSSAYCCLSCLFCCALSVIFLSICSITEIACSARPPLPKR